MSKIENGGTAFPLPMGSETTQGSDGMTLRDYFAGQAIVGIISKGDLIRETRIAEHAYLIADAMLKAREE